MPSSWVGILARKRAGEKFSLTDAKQIEMLLTERLHNARKAWPGVALPEEQFLGYLAERLPLDMPLDRAIRNVHVGDLFLACACATGARRAMQAFEEKILHGLSMTLGRSGFSPLVCAEGVQLLRKRLLVKDGDKPLGVSQYRGIGPLRAWVRVAALREAQMLVRKHKAEASHTARGVSTQSMPLLDPELGYLKSAYRSHFKEAFAHALQTLSSKDRMVLRHQYLFGRSIDEVGELYGIHRATAARWVQRARDKLLDETKRELMTRFHLTEGEVASVLRLIRSRLDASIWSILDNSS